VYLAGGLKLSVDYTGLIEAPKNVRCEDVTGHSAIVVWNNGSFESYYY